MSEITRALAVTAELTGTELSVVALQAMERELGNYQVAAVITALTRCRRELTGRLTLAAVLERIESADGRPTANEAWGIALSGYDEAMTIITNQEINAAMSVARPIMDAGDEVGARMAFRDSYERTVTENRNQGVNPEWYPSMGSDKRMRASIVAGAIERGMLSMSYFAELPAPVQGDGRGVVAFLENKEEPRDLSPKARQKLQEIRSMFGKRKAA